MDNKETDLINDNYLDDCGEITEFGDAEIRDELRRRFDGIDYVCAVYRRGQGARWTSLFAAAFFGGAIYLTFIYELKRYAVPIWIIVISAIFALVLLIPAAIILHKIIYPIRRYYFNHEAQAFILERRSRRNWIFIYKKTTLQYRRNQIKKIKYNGLTRDLNHFFTGIFLEKIAIKKDGNFTKYYNDFYEHLPTKKFNLLDFIIDIILILFGTGSSRRATGSGYTDYIIYYKNGELKKSVFVDNRTQNFHKRHIIFFSRCNDKNVKTAIHPLLYNRIAETIKSLNTCSYICCKR
ncbi:MAG: hypothetical protein LBP26_02365 [Clostridiales bacterium]|jgi:hypothetical protein|nr:hypothetical protein [Clostridiales bacterium]